MLASGLVIAPGLPAVAETTATPPPEAFALVDAGTGAVITARHLHEALPPASTVKIMTALLAVERLPLDATIPVSALRAAIARSYALTLGPPSYAVVSDRPAGSPNVLSFIPYRFAVALARAAKPARLPPPARSPTA